MGAKELYHKIYQAKKYIALHKRLQVVRNGQVVVEDIEFTGGGHSNNRKITGKFSTQDPAIQEALEKNKGFNIEYKIIRTEKIGTVPEKTEEKVGTGLETGNDTDKQSKDQGTEKGEVLMVDEVKTVGEARQYIIENFKDDIQVSKIRNKADVMQAAKTLNVEFPNLPE